MDEHPGLEDVDLGGVLVLGVERDAVGLRVGLGAIGPCFLQDVGQPVVGQMHADPVAGCGGEYGPPDRQSRAAVLHASDHLVE